MQCVYLTVRSQFIAIKFDTQGRRSLLECFDRNDFQETGFNWRIKYIEFDATKTNLNKWVVLTQTYGRSCLQMSSYIVAPCEPYAASIWRCHPSIERSI